MKKMASAIILRVLVYGAIAALILPFAFFLLYSHPKRNISLCTPASVNLKFKDVSFPAADGVPLAAWFIENKNSDSAVIAMHGYPMDKGNILGMVSFLAKDFNLLMFDFRACGKSGGTFSTGGVKEQRDLDGAVKYLESRGFRKIALYGFSMGAATALYSRNPAIKAKAVDSPYENLRGVLYSAFSVFGPFKKPLVFCMNVWNRLISGFSIYDFSVSQRLRENNIPVLIFHGEDDTTVPVSNSLEIKEENPRVNLILIPKADHGEASFFGGKKYEEEIIRFFKRYLDEPRIRTLGVAPGLG